MTPVVLASTRPTPPSFLGGAEVSLALLGEELASAGRQVTAVGSYTHPRWHDARALPAYARSLPASARWTAGEYGAIARYHHAGVECLMTSRDDWLAALDSMLSEARPVVMTTCEASVDAVQAARRHQCRSVAWVMDTSDEDGGCTAHSGADVITYASAFLRKHWTARGAPPGPVLHPPFRPAPRSEDSDRVPRDVILMVNPIPMKGSDLFLELARSRPDLAFVALEGWRRPDWDWNGLPSNLQFVERRVDPTPIYRSARVVLVPSLVEEGFGRVPVEAGLVGRPALVSGRGGLLEAASSGAWITNPEFDAWSAGIDRLLKEEEWHRAREDCLQHSRRFSRPLLPELEVLGLGL